MPSLAMLVFALNCMLCRVDEWYAVIRHCFFSEFSHSSTFVLGTWPTFPTTSSDNPTFFGGGAAPTTDRIHDNVFKTFLVVDDRQRALLSFCSFSSPNSFSSLRFFFHETLHVFLNRAGIYYN